MAEQVYSMPLEAFCSVPVDGPGMPSTPSHDPWTSQIEVPSSLCRTQLFLPPPEFGMRGRRVARTPKVPEVRSSFFFAMRPFVGTVRFLRLACCCRAEPCEEVLREQYKGYIQYCQNWGDLTEREKMHAAQMMRKVPPNKWCLSKEDFRRFTQEVRVAWELGLIMPSARNSFNKKSKSNPNHWADDVGPSMYDVNEQFLKPITAEAGGVSYAMMVNPEGHECDLFVSHCWEEGFFEFSDKVLLNWPRGKSYIWCCATALPQNLDITEWLDKDVPETPFGMALGQDPQPDMLLIPNSSGSIWNRLWCVIEAWEATRLSIHVKVPHRPSFRKIMASCRDVDAVFLLGLLLGGVLPESWMHGNFIVLTHLFFHASSVAVGVTGWFLAAGFMGTQRRLRIALAAPMLVVFINALFIATKCRNIKLETEASFAIIIKDQFSCFDFTCAVGDILLAAFVLFVRLEFETMEEHMEMLRKGKGPIEDADCHPNDLPRLRRIVRNHRESISLSMDCVMRVGAMSSDIREAYQGTMGRWITPGQARPSKAFQTLKWVSTSFPWIAAGVFLDFLKRNASAANDDCTKFLGPWAVPLLVGEVAYLHALSSSQAGSHEFIPGVVWFSGGLLMCLILLICHFSTELDQGGWALPVFVCVLVGSVLAASFVDIKRHGFPLTLNCRRFPRLDGLLRGRHDERLASALSSLTVSLAAKDEEESLGLGDA